MSIKLPDNVAVAKEICGGYHTIFLLNDGGVYATGMNTYGQLGLGDTTDMVLPTKLNISNVKDVTCGMFHTIFLLNDGTVYGCGFNQNGELGIGDGANKLIPTKINISNVKKVICGRSNTIFVLNDNTIYVCGDNSCGQSALSSSISSTVIPIKVPTKVDISNVKDIVCGQYHTMVLFNDGTVSCCGLNNDGQLGLGDTTDKSVLTKINITDIKAIRCGTTYTVFILNDDTIYGCGTNSSGQLGLGNNTSPIKTPTKLTMSNVKDIVCSANGVTIFLMNDGTVYGCGNNYYKQFSSDGVNKLIPVKLDIPYTIRVTCGSGQFIFTLKDGSIYGCGNNHDGQLGLGDKVNPVATPTLIIDKPKPTFIVINSMIMAGIFGFHTH